MAIEIGQEWIVLQADNSHDRATVVALELNHVLVEFPDRPNRWEGCERAWVSRGVFATPGSIVLYQARDDFGI